MSTEVHAPDAVTEVATPCEEAGTLRGLSDAQLEAVRHGVGATGRIITGAALIIVVVFIGFASGELVGFQQMGFGVAVALLLDATVIRTVLVPSSMVLLGKWNWYLPSWLEWLPHLEHGGSAEVVEAPPTVAPTA